MLNECLDKGEYGSDDGILFARGPTLSDVGPIWKQADEGCLINYGTFSYFSNTATLNFQTFFNLNICFQRASNLIVDWSKLIASSSLVNEDNGQQDRGWPIRRRDNINV